MVVATKRVNTTAATRLARKTLNTSSRTAYRALMIRLVDCETTTAPTTTPSMRTGIAMSSMTVRAWSARMRVAAPYRPSSAAITSSEGWPNVFSPTLITATAGAVAASRGDKHINIAILDRFLPGRLRTASKFVVDLFTSAICGVVSWHSLQFVLTSHEFGDVLLGGVPAWLLQSVLPVGFGLICYRYALFAIRDLVGLFRAGGAEA